MKKIYENLNYNLSLYDVSTSIIYNDEKIKKDILNNISLSKFNIIDSELSFVNTSISKFLKMNSFDMSLVPYFKLEGIMSKNVFDIDLETSIYLKIIILITISKKPIIFNDILSFLNDEKKELVLSYLKNNKLLFFNFTSDIEETVYTKYLIVLSGGGVAIEGATINVFKEEKLIKKLGFSLPFALDLSLQLKSYNIIDEEVYDVDKLVSALWKK